MPPAPPWDRRELISTMKQHGKKYKEWIEARDKPNGLIDQAIRDGEIRRLSNGRIVGYCKDCGRFKDLNPDHKIKRSQGGSHTKDNIDWVCHDCHMKRDQGGDPNKAKPPSKKADWTKLHKCKHCNANIMMLMCPDCGKMSV